jgi:hypothetical protein
MLFSLARFRAPVRYAAFVATSTKLVLRAT